MFVVLSLAGSCCAQRSPCVVCHFPYDSVNDYPCSQRQEEESLPHGHEIEETLPFRPSPKCRTLSQQPFHISALNSFPCYHQVSSVRAPSARTFLLRVQVFTMAYLPHFLQPRFTDCLNHWFLPKGPSSTDNRFR